MSVGFGDKDPVDIDDGELVEVGGSVIDEGLVIGGSVIEGVVVGDPGVVKELDSEKPLVLEIILDPALVDDGRFEVEPICDVAIVLEGEADENELDKLKLNVLELADVEPADDELADDELADDGPADDGPADELAGDEPEDRVSVDAVLADGVLADGLPADTEPEVYELDLVALEPGTIVLTDKDEETVTDELITVVLGTERLLVDVLVTGGLLGDKETEVTVEIVLEADRESELDADVSVDDQALGV